MQNVWSKNETKCLFDLVYRAVEEGKGVSSAFAAMAVKSGKSVNSIRSYYYSQLKVFEMMPEFSEKLGIRTVPARREEFEAFTEAEVDQLVTSVLVGRAEGKSVRAIIFELADGNKKQALRLQNKYRSLVTHHKDRVQKVMTGLRERKMEYFDPYLSVVVTESTQPVSDNLTRLMDYIALLSADERVSAVKLLLSK